MSDDLDADELLNQLRKLQPAAVTLDPRETFYQAGFVAAVAQQRPKRSLGPWLAACVLLTMVGIPASYQVGRNTADERAFVVQAEPSEIVPEEQLAIAKASPPAQQPNWFGHWFQASNGLAESAQRNQSAAMLTVSHSAQWFRLGNEFEQGFDHPTRAAAVGSDRDALVEAEPLFARSSQDLSFNLEATR